MADVLSDNCPEAIQHGPLDAKGRCPFCIRKVGPTVPAPRRVPVSEMTEWYGLYFDPDWGVEDPV